jgi:HSP20 family protein
MALVSFRGFDPFSGLVSLQESLDRLMQEPGLGLNMGLGGGGVFPTLNIFGDEDGMVVRAEVPGVPADKINISVEPRRLTISGERTGASREKGSYHRRERRYGEFARTLQLPDELDADKATAECKNGLLTIRIPKAAAAKPRQISVQGA